MVCKKCGKNIPDRTIICPHCGNSIKVEPIKHKKTSANKGIKSAIKLDDESALVGGVVSNKSFIKLQKTSVKKEIQRKDFNNYIDYKEAKEAAQQKELKKISKSSKSILKSADLEENVNKAKVSKSAKNVVALRNDKNSANKRVSKSSKSILNNSNSEDIIKKANVPKKVKDAVSIKNNKGIVYKNSNKNDNPFDKTNVPKRKFTQEEIYNPKDLYGANASVVRNKVNIDYSKFKENSGIEVDNNKQKNFIIRIDNVKDSNGKKARLGFFNSLAYILIIGLWIFALGFVISSTKENYYFNENKDGVVVGYNGGNLADEEMSKYNGVSKSGQKSGATSEGVTSIVYDNQYMKQFTLTNMNDVTKLIATDSIKQKGSCPANIINIENEIINNYGIIAVNFCEIDEIFAKELRDVIKYVYVNYPRARNYLTNITIANVGDNTFIAAFMPVFYFATSNTSSGYPLAVKTQIILNAKYFLNESKITSSVKYSSKSGYFPPNASRSSTVAHEFGHYLSYVAMLNYHQSKQLNYVKANQSKMLYEVYDDFNNGTYSYELLTEAYDEYKQEYKGVSFDNFRKSISTYAMSKDKNGMYIYDETIAEAFHDVYLNGENAKPASRYIMKVLNDKL